VTGEDISRAVPGVANAVQAGKIRACKNALIARRTFTTDIDEFFKHVCVRMEYFAALPTSTTVEVRRLSHPDFLVEVEAIAVVENK
jgi:enamine deaminase RidA (YjgF/YER057c/UK114 family)